MWFDDGVGVDPMVPGATGIQVPYTIGDSDATIANAMAGAVTTGALNEYVLNTVGNIVTFTAATIYADATNAADGAAPTGFTFNVTQHGSNSSPTTTCVAAGEIRYDQNFIYSCIGVNTWKRVPVDTW